MAEASESIQREEIAAQSRAARLGDVQRRGAGDGSVGRVPALHEDGQPRLRRQRLTRRDHPSRRMNDGSPGIEPRIGFHLRIKLIQ